MTDFMQKDRKTPCQGGPVRADQFERHRRYLTGLAYRMLGSLAEAEDAVQEAYIRWHRTEKASIEFGPRVSCQDRCPHLP